MKKATVFKNNRSQVARQTKAVALPEDMKPVDIVATGRTRIITPAGESWNTWFDSNAVTADFISAREQPDDQVRQTGPTPTDDAIRD
ncbi:AbrB/MazE/SpoVT family DNA-binding domain-containing protein [Erwinia sp. E602]|uniref:type II toxin-antitoxin system VapB family antitoxin n=1 Tax=Erwinia sp. E602 TaxID=2675378 RepID=UPI001BA6BF10|nr:type II toxin-antitoxin system VapB family antitoxin [Erwinia sp. E602]QUG74906.1 AbrB/MazE/SpoVT family DNA-binding domain-containing protein [Erwinia sp. E602]